MRVRLLRVFNDKILGRIPDSDEIITLSSSSHDLVPGDYVVIQKVNNDFSIREVEKRRNEIFRIAVRQRRKKIMAANCDLLMVIVSMSTPPYKRGVIDRFLIRSTQWNIKTIIVFNKMDEYDKKNNLPFERDRLKGLSISCFEISAKYPDYKNRFLSFGFKELKEELSGKTIFLTGQSGVGKSKTIGALTGKIVKTAKVGTSGKGVHTTTWSELIDYNGFSIIDSPGIRSFSLDDIEKEKLYDYYPDLHPIMRECEFNNCSHERGSQGCAFWKLPDNYQTKLILSRLDSFSQINKEVGKIPSWKKKKSSY